MGSILVALTVAVQLAIVVEDKQKVEEQHIKALSEVDHLRLENAGLRHELEDCHRQMHAAGLEVRLYMALSAAVIPPLPSGAS